MQSEPVAKEDNSLQLSREK